MIAPVPVHCFSITFMLARREHNQTSWKEFIARNINGVLESETQLLYPGWPLRDAVNAGFRIFLTEATLDTTDLE